MKEHIIEEAMDDIRNELCQLHDALCKHARGEKYAQLVVIISYLVYLIVVMVGNNVTLLAKWCFLILRCVDGGMTLQL